jgi:hypothetical protein
MGEFIRIQSAPPEPPHGSIRGVLKTCTLILSPALATASDALDSGRFPFSVAALIFSHPNERSVLHHAGEIFFNHMFNHAAGIGNQQRKSDGIGKKAGC